MFNASSYKHMYDRFLGPLAQPIMIALNNGVNFDEFEDIKAYVTKYNERDLTPGGSIQLGDLRLIILRDNLPWDMRDLTQKDRIEIDGRVYSVMHWDNYTRKIGDKPVAIEVAVRG